MIRSVFCFFSILALLVSVPTFGQAAGIDLKSIEPLKPVDFMPQAEFKDKTQVIEAEPFNDSYLAFQVRLPKDWTESIAPPETGPSEERLSDRILGAFAKYIAPPEKHVRSFFTLETQELTYEVSARNWFINYLLSNGLYAQRHDGRVRAGC